jgi:hypothetical protein
MSLRVFKTSSMAYSSNQPHEPKLDQAYKQHIIQPHTSIIMGKNLEMIGFTQQQYFIIQLHHHEKRHQQIIKAMIPHLLTAKTNIIKGILGMVGSCNSKAITVAWH